MAKMRMDPELGPVVAHRDKRLRTHCGQDAPSTHDAPPPPDPEMHPSANEPPDDDDIQEEVVSRGLVRDRAPSVPTPGASEGVPVEKRARIELQSSESSSSSSSSGSSTPSAVPGQALLYR